eukprot:jgi/Psemu1/188258/e_gw1.75.2.1
MYCGDETGSFIGEIGSHTCRFGYGGEDNPKLTTPSYVVASVSSRDGENKNAANGNGIPRRRIGNANAHNHNHNHGYRDYSLPITDPDSFLRQGEVVENWDNLQTAWENGMDVLRATDTLKHTRGAGAGFRDATRRQQYATYTEVLMESMDATSAFLAPAPMLAAFSMGRQTALVVDIGAGGCRVTPVVDGLILKQSQRRSGRGGDWLGDVTWRALLEEKERERGDGGNERTNSNNDNKGDSSLSPATMVRPRYMLTGNDTNKYDGKLANSVFHRRAMNDLMYEIRTEPFASLYELPDGTQIDLSSSSFGKDLCQLPELLFCEESALPFQHHPAGPAPSSSSSAGAATFSRAPLHRLIHESLLAVGDVDVRKELAGCICLVGATSLLPNIETRLSQELSALLPSFVKPKVIAPKISSVERSCAAWIGASILTSLGSFQQLWLSRAEYEEYGAGMSIQRFP